MKHRKIFSIVLVLGLLLCSTTFAPVGAQPDAQRLRLDSGVIRLGPGQVLRLTVNGQSGNDKLSVVFRRMYYVGSANGGVWKSSILAQDTSAPVIVGPDEAASADISQGSFAAVRIEALIRGYTGTTHVNTGVLQIINSDGSVAAFCDAPGGIL